MYTRVDGFIAAVTKLDYTYDVPICIVYGFYFVLARTHKTENITGILCRQYLPANIVDGKNVRRQRRYLK